MSPKTLEQRESDLLLEELLQFRGTARYRRNGPRNHLIALLMLDAGLRVGEVVKLRIGDLFYNSQPVRSIIIPSEISKNGQERQIPVSERLSNALKQCGDTIWSGIMHFPSCHAFQEQQRSRCLTTRQVERIISSAAMRALGRPIHPHILRHTFATRLMKVCDIRTVQELLGHKSVSSTQVYTHPDEEDKRNAINAVAKNSTPKPV